MAGGLVARLMSRTTFVVGKGGVGKTTTASALALALADSGEHTHLLSTDPAHSLGDVFLFPLPPGGACSPCTERLTLEELDAEGLARAHLTGLEPALRELIDRGTYLDREDADTLLGGTVPGLTEIGAALRIADLADSGSRLVVDTAPTGHTLRLLDTQATVGGWLEVFHAIAAKADAVSTALVGRSSPIPGEEAVEALGSVMARFTAVIRSADFVVVTGAGELVTAETARLLAALEDRGLKVAATVAMARPGATAEVLLPLRPGLAGCERLRAWWRDGMTGGVAAVTAAAAGSRADDADRGERRGPAGIGGIATRAAPLPDSLDRELIVVAGKGGVGKTSCAAALAVRLARDGPVLALGADPAGSLVDVIGGSVPGLRVVESDAAAEFDRFKERYRRGVEEAFAVAGLHGTARLDEAVVQTLLGAAPPGLDELVAIARLIQDAPTGRIVLDTAPTGHFLRLMSMPGEALDWTHRLMRILLKYRLVGGVDSLGESLLRLARRLRGLRARFVDPERTAIVVVTLDEPVVAAETGRLIGRLRDLGVPLAALLVNRADDRADLEVMDSAAGLPILALPTVAEPVGQEALLTFIQNWERIA